MKLWVLPDDGLAPLLKAIDSAQSSIDILIFRFDRKDVEAALTRAVGRGVAVRALVAHANKAGEDSLRQLEQRLLGRGCERGANGGRSGALSRQIDDRGPATIVSSCAFNFTRLDTERTRSFGIVTSNRTLVQETVKLFEADTKRLSYTPRARSLVVSPANARKRLAAFIRGGEERDPDLRPRRQRSRYDPASGRASQGGRHRPNHRPACAPRTPKLEVHKLAKLRLHTRTIIRDGKHAFVGSQSLRAAELDARREVGVIFSDRKIVPSLVKVFREDWQFAETNKGADADGRESAR